MVTDKKQGNEWIKLKLNKKDESIPREIRIDYDGHVYMDGELYDEEKSKYSNLSIDVEQHNRMSSGEETRRIIELSKEAKKGETITVKDERGPDRRETTTVKF
ncbi:MAG: hypothetical protein GX080_04860 [Tissierellia bacterium]|nr:hypothetical protein [Tissierellia bacterium]